MSRRGPAGAPQLEALADRALGLVEAAGEAAVEAVDGIVDYLDSDEGRRLRRVAAAGLIACAPFIARLPWMRATRIGRLIGLAGGAALVVKAAELIRDWEPRRTAARTAGRDPGPSSGS